MNQRMLDKNIQPTLADIESWMGQQSYNVLQSFTTHMQTHYDLNMELKFPFGNDYGWGYKYSHKSTHLCYAFLKKMHLQLCFR